MLKISLKSCCAILLSAVLPIGGCSQMEHVELKVKQLDKALTRDWQPVCLGHYSLKLPPQWLPLEKDDLRFDGYKFEIEKAVYAGALSAAVNEKEQELARLEVPAGLKSVIHREEGDRRNEYLVAYRDGGNEFPSALMIVGMKKLKKTIVTYHQDALDGYKQAESKTSLRNQWFAEDYSAGQRLLRLLEPIKNPAKPGRGFCLDNQVIIRGGSVTNTADSLDFFYAADDYLFDVSITTNTGAKEGFDLFKNLENIARQEEYQGEAWRAKINGMEGGLARGVDPDDGSVLYGWMYVESLPNTRRKLIIRIRLEERNSPYMGKNKDELDALFYNILGSFHRRDK